MVVRAGASIVLGGVGSRTAGVASGGRASAPGPVRTDGMEPLEQETAPGKVTLVAARGAAR